MLLRIFSKRIPFDHKGVEWQRKKFEKMMSMLFPALAFRGNFRYSHIAGVKVMELWTKHSSAQTVIVYIHGGGFVIGSSKSYLQHLVRLSKQNKAKIISVEYSLAPESRFPTAIEQVKKVLAEISAPNLVLMGDSSGANLAIATTLELRKDNMRQPNSVVLLSPAIDAQLSGPSYIDNADKDHVLSMDKLSYFAKTYAGQEALDHPLISPIHAKLHNLPPMIYFIGDHELSLSDALTFHANAERDGASLEMHIVHGAWHVWPLYAWYIPEAKVALRQVSDFITRHTKQM